MQLACHCPGRKLKPVSLATRSSYPFTVSDKLTISVTTTS